MIPLPDVGGVGRGIVAEVHVGLGVSEVADGAVQALESEPQQRQGQAQDEDRAADRRADQEELVHEAPSLHFTTRTGRPLAHVYSPPGGEYCPIGIPGGIPGVIPCSTSGG